MLASSAEAGLTTTALSRHVPLLRRNIRTGDQVSLLSRCVGSDGLGSGDHVLMLTGERLVVTRQSRLLGRVRLCLDAPVAAIENLRWSADPAGPGVELNFTVLEGPGATEPHRWHFWLPASHAKRVWRVDALLARAFRRPKVMARPAGRPRQPQRPNPLVSPSGVFPVVPAPLAGAIFPEAGGHPRSPLPMSDTVRLERLVRPAVRAIEGPAVRAIEGPRGQVPSPRPAPVNAVRPSPGPVRPGPVGPAPTLAAALPDRRAFAGPACDQGADRGGGWTPAVAGRGPHPRSASRG
ncbi:hypothetical protein [Glycomyces sp. NPDC047010]|uniref:hypothetical protein n=1 Tax=Glycomyces sp. NPDC047010 TaxID=3155023 RepID=UPI0033E70D77